jgi:photosynthetic reaction center H subunit
MGRLRRSRRRHLLHPPGLLLQQHRLVGPVVGCAEVREGAREGYPLEEDTTGRSEGAGIFFFPPKKTFNLPNGRGSIEMSYGPADTRAHAMRRTAPWPGAPMEPDGNPMTSAVGPGSYAQRLDEPDLNWDGSNRIVPYRLHPEYTVSGKDLDPRGLSVVGLDRVTA